MVMMKAVYLSEEERDALLEVIDYWTENRSADEPAGLRSLVKSAWSHLATMRSYS